MSSTTVPADCDNLELPLIVTAAAEAMESFALFNVNVPAVVLLPILTFPPVTLYVASFAFFTTSLRCVTVPALCSIEPFQVSPLLIVACAVPEIFIVLALSTVNVTSFAIIPLLDKFNTLAVEPSPTVTEPLAKFVSVSVVNVVFSPVTLNAFEPVPDVITFA